MGRFIIVVLGSFGIGAMRDVPEVRPADCFSNTAKHILEAVPNAYWPTLERLGLMNALGEEVGRMHFSKQARFGKANLAHIGADSFLGHQEIMGTEPKPPVNQAFNECIKEVADHLSKKGHQVRFVGADDEPKILVVDETVTVGDNLETDLGQVFNVSSCLDWIDFQDVVKIGREVREVVKVSRVITFGGRGITLQNLLDARKVKENRFAGIDAPESGVCDHDYHVIHLGYGIDPNVQAPTLIHQANIPVFLLGKIADIIQVDGSEDYPGVQSEQLFNQLEGLIEKHPTGFFALNIQETDLAGHAENPARYEERLSVCDQKLAELLPKLAEEDILVVMADHGNDPTIGHSQHTREQVPLLFYKKGTSKVDDLGVAKSMADIGATAADYFGTKPPQHGTSWLAKLKD